MCAPSDLDNVVLIGFMGAGKSTIGAALARLLNFNLVDLDDVIVQRCGRTIPEIFAAEGEGAFRDHETAALASLADRRGMVLATGGGSVHRPENWRIMRRLGIIVYLRAAWPSLADRIAGDAGRPLAIGNDVYQLWERRLPLYQQADVIVDSDRCGVEESARRLVEALRDGKP